MPGSLNNAECGSKSTPCGQPILSAQPEVTHMALEPSHAPRCTECAQQLRAEQILHSHCCAGWGNILVLLWHSLSSLQAQMDPTWRECIRLCWQAGDLEAGALPISCSWKQSIFFVSLQPGQGAGINNEVTQPLPCYYSKQLEGHQTRAPRLSNRRFPACLLLGFTGGTLGVCRFFLCLLLSRDTTSKTPRQY